MDVAQWLNAIGLGQYEALFREHEIDADVLPELTEADLEKIGVPLGHRKRLMRAIGNLASKEAPPSAPKSAPAAPSPSPMASRADAERRPITVMFCDLVGSTGLAARLDAEDWRNLVGATKNSAAKARVRAQAPLLRVCASSLAASLGMIVSTSITSVASAATSQSMRSAAHRPALSRRESAISPTRSSPSRTKA